MSPTQSSILEQQTAQGSSYSQSEPLVTPIVHRPRRLRRTETLRLKQAVPEILVICN